MMQFLAIVVLFSDAVADANLLKCNECLESDATKSKCSRDQIQQTCALDRNSVGTSHCASLAGRYRLTRGTDIQEFFYRGCIDCESKKAACFALGGYFKGKNDDDALINLLQCEIECCTGNNCNNQVPTLSPNAIDVFTPTANGPKQCNLCFEDDAAECTKKQQTAICATDRFSFGTSHCGSVIGRFSNKKGAPSIVYARGCVNCADKKAACAAFQGFLKRRGIAMMECEIECCTGDNCNTNFPSFSKRGGSTDVAAIPEAHYTLLCGLLSLTTIFAEILDHL